jgi:hypothetical protein
MLLWFNCLLRLLPEDCLQMLLWEDCRLVIPLD